MKIYISIFYFFITTVFLSQSKLLKVPENYPKIQEAINASVNGDTVLVAPGTYIENINFRGKQILVTSHFLFDNNISKIKSTIINGGKPKSTDSASVVTFAKGETNNSILQGFTITSGKGTKTYNVNEAKYFRTGGGILIDRSSPIIQHNIITKNEVINKSGVSGAGGGGIRAGQSKAIIRNNLIKSNKGGYAGGIMLAFSGGVTFTNNIVSSNESLADFDGGGGIYIDYENVPIINCTVVNNYSGGSGGGMIITGTKNEIKNSIFYNNSALVRSNQIYDRFGGSSSISYSNIQGFSGGTGNIDSEPMLIDLESFLLQNNSPCIDAGSPEESFYDPAENNSEQALFPSLGTKINDMGAYGGPNRSISFSNVTSIQNEKIIEDILILRQNYPNPFNPNTTIEYEIPATTNQLNTNVKVAVFDILGKEVITLINESHLAGKYSIIFNASNLSNGVYFLKLQFNDAIKTRKMILLK